MQPVVSNGAAGDVVAAFGEGACDGFVGVFASGKNGDEFGTLVT